MTSYNRAVGAYLSADELAHYQRLKAREREVLKVGDLDDETLADIAAAQYGVEARRASRRRSRAWVYHYTIARRRIPHSAFRLGGG